MLRFSANIGFLWPDRPLLDRIAAAGRAGFDAVELHWPYDVPAEAIATAAKGAGVRVLALNTAVGNKGEFGLGALPGREVEFEAAFEQSLAYAVTIGATQIHAMAGVVDADARSEATFVANLQKAADRAATHGVGLLLEAINPRDRPGYFFSTQEAAAAIAEKTGRANVRLMLDTYHIGVGQGDLLTRLRRFLPVAGHIQIAAVPSRAEPDEGEIAYDRVLAALEALGYDGYIGLEYRPRGDTDAGLAFLEKLGYALKPGG